MIPFSLKTIFNPTQLCSHDLFRKGPSQARRRWLSWPGRQAGVSFLISHFPRGVWNSAFKQPPQSVLRIRARVGLAPRSPNSCPFTDLCSGNERANGRAISLHRNFAKKAAPGFKLIRGTLHALRPCWFILSSLLGVVREWPAPNLHQWRRQKRKKTLFPLPSPAPHLQIQPLTRALEGPGSLVPSGCCTARAGHAPPLTQGFHLHTKALARSKSCLCPSWN